MERYEQLSTEQLDGTLKGTSPQVRNYLLRLLQKREDAEPYVAELLRDEAE